MKTILKIHSARNVCNNRFRSILLGVAIIATRGLLSAQTLTQTGDPGGYWSGVASSADGTHLVAVGGAVYGQLTHTNNIYVSTNAGTSWMQTTAPALSWVSVASSADGRKLAAVAQGFIYTSADAGANWQSNQFPFFVWRSIASSADGSKLFAMTSAEYDPGRLYISTNSGLTWVSNSSPGSVWSIASSTDGSKLITGGYSLPRLLYSSTNSGQTWVTNNAPTANWWSVASSANGAMLLAAAGGGYPDGHIYASTNSGATWNTNAVPLYDWKFVAMSADGTKMIAAAGESSGKQKGPIYTSMDSGLTWISNNLPEQVWSSVASSADGSTFFASSWPSGTTNGPGRIWIAQTTPAPSLSIAHSGTNSVLSWTVPSANFSLQKSFSASMTNYVDVTNLPSLNLTNLNNEVTLPLLMTNVFFRLKAQ